VAGSAEFLAGLIEGVGENGEDDFALGAADEIEAAFLLDELGGGRHFRVADLRVRCSARKRAFGSIHRIGKGIKGKLDAGERKIDLYQIGTDALDAETDKFSRQFAA